MPSFPMIFQRDYLLPSCCFAGFFFNATINVKLGQKSLPGALNGRERCRKSIPSHTGATEVHCKRPSRGVGKSRGNLENTRPLQMHIPYPLVNSSSTSSALVLAYDVFPSGFCSSFSTLSQLWSTGPYIYSYGVTSARLSHTDVWYLRYINMLKSFHSVSLSCSIKTEH